MVTVITVCLSMLRTNAFLSGWAREQADCARACTWGLKAQQFSLLLLSVCRFVGSTVVRVTVEVSLLLRYMKELVQNGVNEVNQASFIEHRKLKLIVSVTNGFSVLCCAEYGTRYDYTHVFISPQDRTHISFSRPPAQNPNPTCPTYDYDTLSLLLPSPI